MTPEELVEAHYKDARTFTKYIWNQVVRKLPAWMRDDWEGVADEALWEAARGYREEAATFSTFLYGVIQRAVWGTLTWSHRKKRLPTVEVGPLVKEMAAPPEPEGLADIHYLVWSAAMSRAPQLVYARYVEEKTLTETQRSRMKKVRKRVYKDFHKRYEDSL